MDQGQGRIENRRSASLEFGIRTKMRSVCLFLLAVVMCIPVVPGTAGAVATGVTDGIYDFGGTLAAHDGTYNKTGDKFLVSKDLVKSGTGLWPQTQTDKTIPGVIMLRAEGTSVLGSFTFRDLGFSAVSSGLKLDFLHVTLYDSKGSMITTIDNYNYAGGAKLSVGTSTVKLSTLINSGNLFQMNNVAMIKILWTFEDDLAPSRLKLDNINIANVQKSKYGVYFNSNGGTAVSSQTVLYNNKATMPANPTRVGYSFGGWYKEAALTTAFDFAAAITKDTTVYAKWTPINYTVTFNSNGGTAISGQTVGSNGIPVKPADPTKSGNTFGGWYKEATLTTPYTFTQAITGNTTLYAKWTPITYTVTFNSNGGTAVISKTVSYNGTITAPTAPTRTGYTFGGWYKDAGLTTAFAFATAITGNTTLYAKWTVNTYTVTFESNGGTAVSNKTVSYNGTITAPAAPTRTGYTFGGWYKDAGLATAFVYTTAITANTTLYAKWTLNTYTVAFNSNGGTNVISQTVSHNNKVTAPTAPTKAGSTFGGWYKEAALTTPFVFTATAITGNTTLYAKWVSNYTVTFNSNGGTGAGTQTVSHGNTATEPTVPTRTGYTFVGWYTDVGLAMPFVFTTPIIENAVLRAKWMPIDYAVTFDTNGGTLVSQQTVSYNSLATLPSDPTKSGSTFGWWYTDAGLTIPFVFTTPIAGHTTLYAKWTTDSYTVMFDSNEGSPVSVQEVTYGSMATEPLMADNPIKTGYMFEDWYEDDALTTPFEFATTAITGNTTIYAKWIPIDYTVTFDTNGGTSLDDLAVSYLGTVTEPTVPTRVGHAFDGWYADEELTEAFLFTTPIKGDTILHAKWTANGYTVTFDSKEGSAVTSQEVDYNGLATEPPPAEHPTKIGYTFEDWYEDEALTTPFVFTTPITGDTTLYAGWTPIDYTVTFNSNGGTSLGDLAVRYLGTVTKPAAPAKTGYAFEGWYTDEEFTIPFEFTTPIAGDTTLYANWITNSYAVTFDSDEGSTVSDQQVTYNGTASEPADPTKVGYTFGGWYEDAGLTEPFLFTTAIAEDTVLYAKWATGSYAVTFNSNGGTTVSSQAVSYNGTATEPTDPTKISHTFDGWHTDEELTTPFNFASVIMGNTTLYAKWITSSNVDLSNLIVSDTHLSPDFTTNRTQYTANVFNGIRSVTVTAWAESSSVIKVNNSVVESGQASGEISLNEGENTIVVDVTAQDGSTKAYSVTLTRAPAAPVGLVVEANDGTATLNWESVQDSVSYNVYGGTASRSYGATPIASVSGATYSYVVSGLTNGTSYYFTVTASSIGGASLYSNEVIAMPLSGDTSLRSLNLSGITLSPTFEPGVYSYTASVTNGTSATSVTAAVYEENAAAKIIVNGKEILTDRVSLNVGRNKIDIVVTAQNGTTNAYVVTVDRASPSSSSSDSESNQVKPQLPGEIQLKIDGKSYDRIASAGMTGEHELTITVDAARMLDLLEKIDRVSVVGMHISSTADDISALLPGDIVKAMESKHLVWEIHTPYGNYSLPASEIGIDRVAQQLGTDLLKDIIVQVRIGKSNANGAGNRPFTFVGQPVDFRITAAYKGKTEVVSKFFSYIVREIPLPAGVKPNGITTAVVRNEDGTIRHVPTYVRSRDGQYFAIIHSLTNSVYALIKNQVTFSDVDEIWSKDAVNDLASRLIVNGTDKTHYDPNKAVTRAEFAAIIVRALGLSDIGGITEFTDVKSGDWYAGAVSKAQEYGIINGYKDGTFRPADTITREEAMSLVIRAMELSGVETAVNTNDIEATLSKLAGNEEISAWAKPAVASAVKIGIVNGSDAGLKPASEMTRAETAVIVQRMLKKAKLID